MEKTFWHVQKYFFCVGKTFQEDAWTVSVYSNKWEPYYMEQTLTLNYQFRPRLFTSISDLLAFLNKDVVKSLKRKLGQSYNTSTHSFSLKLVDDRVVFNKGKKLMSLVMSKNLTHLLGFQENTLDQNVRSATPPTSLKQPTQRVLLMADFINPIPYGERRIPLLQEFVHDSQGFDIIEKRFEPLSYISVARQSIDTITIQLVNDDESPITAKDAKTVLVLHFRQI